MSVKIIHVQEELNALIHLVAIPVMMLTNAPQELITAAVKPAVKIQADLLFANANRGIKVIWYCYNRYDMHHTQLNIWLQF